MGRRRAMKIITIPKLRTREKGERFEKLAKLQKKITTNYKRY